MSAHARPHPLALTQSMLAIVAMVGALIALRAFDLLPGHGGALFALGFLVVAGAVGGQLAALAGLPRLTGNLIAGILAGPEGFALLDAKDVKSLALINALALALIALQAGAEITLPTLVRVWRGVLASGFVQVLVVIPLVGGAFFALSSKIPFMHGLPLLAVLSVALLWGTLSFCRSPSVAMAVLAETRAKGPLSEWLLGVVVLLDVLLLPIFAATLMIARTQIAGLDLDPGALIVLGRDLFASLAAGVTFGLIVAALFRVTRERILVVVVLSYFLTWLCDYLHYDTLLCFVVAGFIVTNLTKLGPALVETSDKTSAGVMIVFFATAGAKLELSVLKELWPIALAFFAVRAIATFIATQVAHRMVKDPPVVRKNGWLCLVSQAGVTIGLAVIAGDNLPGIGKAFASLVIAVVAINELVGAVLTKWALQRAGEIGRADPTAAQHGSPPAPPAAPASA